MREQGKTRNVRGRSTSSIAASSEDWASAYLAQNSSMLDQGMASSIHLPSLRSDLEISLATDMFPSDTTTLPEFNFSRESLSIGPEVGDTTNTSNESVTLTPEGYIGLENDLFVTLKPGTQQRGNPESLDGIVHVLEKTLDDLSSHSPDGDLMDYPFGDILSVFRQFDSHLGKGQYLSTHQHRAPLHECSRKKNALMSAHCYVICIHIMVVLVERMLAQVCSLSNAGSVTPGTNANETGHMPTVPATPTADVTASESNPNLSFTKQDLRLGDMYSHMDPFGHYLSCSYAMIDMSVKVNQSRTAVGTRRAKFAWKPQIIIVTDRGYDLGRRNICFGPRKHDAGEVSEVSSRVLKAS
ncbi:hypothetical protein HD806DRAFT_552838 [Xylariaceae sp. AK1471]|nr:hypothetical protein HD806DRAFT_552838 [Xylariaceae sp. AK1471]